MGSVRFLHSRGERVVWISHDLFLSSIRCVFECLSPSWGDISSARTLNRYEVLAAKESRALGESSSSARSPSRQAFLLARADVVPE
ncbi:UNVERIFIED_CONTAM: hypothetical protein Sradi_4369600 [Sesamum radiatum]|uniref:Uncharacterized protein n=1 Tax=Sesamum radiatum TaxID=300843 RepID=A0AAW2NR71_SESRA